MKTFFELLREPGFGLALAVAFILAGWNLAYGSWVMGMILMALIMGPIGLNLWFTVYKKRKK